jgi:hypothetical protein
VTGRCGEVERRLAYAISEPGVPGVTARAGRYAANVRGDVKEPLLMESPPPTSIDERDGRPEDVRSCEPGGSQDLDESSLARTPRSDDAIFFVAFDASQIVERAYLVSDFGRRPRRAC